MGLCVESATPLLPVRISAHTSDLSVLVRTAGAFRPDAPPSMVGLEVSKPQVRIEKPSGGGGGGGGSVSRIVPLLPWVYLTMCVRVCVRGGRGLPGRTVRAWASP
jgi:hypothetical protein